jgi:hypothetical protein
MMHGAERLADVIEAADRISLRAGRARIPAQEAAGPPMSALEF